ncbi:MAG: hypothetical protein LBQ58_00845, partial [Synergistaceae bacterium]|nr:hypothetical protein [Synergistaceae bacterium]
MRIFLIAAVVISIFFANEALPGETVSLDQFLNMVKSGNDMIISETKSLESAYFQASALLADQRLSLGAALSGSYLTGQDQG